MANEETPDIEENGDAEIVARIDAISRNARTTWFGLIGALVFAGITILGVEDVDFFKADSSTKLPLIGVSVPVGYFFGAGALLITALYIYLHLYLELLWNALGRAPARIKGKPLSEHIFPWLISEWALRYRDHLRGASGENCSTEIRAMSWLGTLISLAFVWLFGLVVLVMFWWFLLPAHYLQASAGIGLLLGIAIWVGLKSWRTARKLLNGESDSLVFGSWADLFGGFSFLTIIWALALASVWLINLHPRAANLVEAQIVKRPADWQDREEAEKTFRAQWAKREGLAYRDPFPKVPRREMELLFRRDWKAFAKGSKSDVANKKLFRSEWAIEKGVVLKTPFAAIKQQNPENQFQKIWKRYREIYLSNLLRPDLDGRNLRKANLQRAFLPKANLREVTLTGANLLEANMEGANLSEARLERANLLGANMEDANLKWARLEGANFKWARLEGADLRQAGLEGANLKWARLEGANLSRARLERANLIEANMEGANLIGANLEGANLIGARLEGANFRGANLEGADLWSVRLEGAKFRRANLEGAKFIGANMERADLIGANLEGADLTLARLEGANLGRARLFGVNGKMLDLNSTNLRAANFSAAALKLVDLSTTNMKKLRNFKNSFGDASVKMPEGFKRPCQWGKVVLSDEKYFGRWRGWLEAKVRLVFVPNDLGKYKAIPPPEGCKWKPEK